MAAFALLLLALLMAFPAWPAGEDAIARAREAYNDHMFEQAATAYKHYLEIFPDGPARDEAGFFHAQCLFLLKDFEAADKAFAREEGVNRAYADQVLYYRGRIAMLDNDFQSALVFFDRLLSEHPGSALRDKAESARAEAHFHQGNAYLSRGAYSIALQQFERAEAGPDLKPLVEYKLGLCHSKLGEFEQAADVWGDLSMMESRGARPAALLAGYRLARLLEDRGRYSESALAFQEIIESQPDHFIAPLARQGLARMWARQGDVEKAVEFWKSEGGAAELIELSGIYASGLEHLVREEYADAERAFQSVLARASDPDLLYSSRIGLARALLGRGVCAAAFDQYELALAHPEANTCIKSEYARAALEVDPSRAASIASQALDSSISECGQELTEVRALALCSMDRDEALEAAGLYLSRYPEGESAAELLVCRARMNLARGLADKAEADLETAMEVAGDPETVVEAALMLSHILRGQGRLESAFSVLEDARPASEKALTAAGRISRARAEAAFSRGQYEKGVSLYEQICGAALPGDTASVDPAPGDTPSPRCGGEDMFRLCWSLFRQGGLDDADACFEGLAKGAGPWSYHAGFWRGMMLLEGGSAEGALSMWEPLSPATRRDRALLDWHSAKAYELSGDTARAMEALTELDRSSPEVFARGALLRLALSASDAVPYLSVMPEPSELDRETLPQEALLGRLRRMSRGGSDPGEMDEVRDMLEVEESEREAFEEGTLLVARARLYGAQREKALAMMEDILKDNPGSRFAGEIKLYRAEDAFFKKDFQGAASWLSGVKLEDVPADLRYRLLYLKGRSYKELRELEKMRPCYLAMVEDHEGEGTASEWLQVGIGLTLVREFSSASVALDKCTQRTGDPGVLAEAGYWKGLVQQGSGESGQALETFMSVAERYPEQNMWAATALYEAAGIHAENGEYDKALDLYKKVLRLAEGDRRTTARVKAKMAGVKKLKRLDNPVLRP